MSDHQPRRKSFVMTHTFEKISRLKENYEDSGEREEHLEYHVREDTVPFTRRDNLYVWDQLKVENWKSLLVGDKLSIEIECKIKNMVGIYKPNLRNFDESMKTHSDVILEVKNAKFHVAKLFLAVHSPFFKELLLDGPPTTEVTLTEVDSDDFQNYLEVLYGDSAIDDVTVEGILFVAKKYNTSIVTEKCEKFLLTKSKKEFSKKQKLVNEYDLKKLRIGEIPEDSSHY